ncbi:hypothetical protein ID0642_04840 [Helicobacter pylori]
MITSFERDEKVLRELETNGTLSNDYRDGINYSTSNLNGNNPTKESLTSQEPPLSILEKSQLEKQKKLESERLAKAEKERLQKIKDKEEAKLKAKIRAQKQATLGKSELDREIAKSENIPYKELENAPNNSFLEVFDNAYKNLDREQFKAFKEMFANNSANFHNLNNDTMLKNFTISPYLTAMR